MSIFSRLLILFMVRKVVYGDSPLIQNRILILKPNFSLEFLLGRECRKKRKSSKSKKKMLSKYVMKKVTAESVTLKWELHGWLKAPESVLSTSVLSTMLKKSVKRKDQLLSFCLHVRNCLQTLEPFPIGEGTFDVISIGHRKTLNSFVWLTKGNIPVISMSYLQECCKF